MSVLLHIILDGLFATFADVTEDVLLISNMVYHHVHIGGIFQGSNFCTYQKYQYLAVDKTVNQFNPGWEGKLYFCTKIICNGVLETPEDL